MTAVSARSATSSPLALSRDRAITGWAGEFRRQDTR